jgi:hypothetical protein
MMWRWRRHQPDYVMLLALSSLLAGSWLARAVPAPNSLSTHLSGGLLAAFYALLAAGSLIGWVSVMWRGSIERALFLELASRCALGTACLVFALALIGLQRWSSAGFLLAWAGTSAWRMVHIVADLRELRGGGR